MLPSIKHKPKTSPPSLMTDDLRRSELRYRRLFESARDGILILEPRTRKIVDANPFMSELLGYPHRQLVGKELWQIGLLKDEESSRRAFRRLERTGFIRYENLPLLSKNGHRRDVEFVSNLYQEGGHEIIQCNIRDITERIRYDNALHLSEERFRALFELGPIGVYSCDLQGRIQEFNRCAARLWGREPRINDMAERYCGSYRMRLVNGTLLAHANCPMAKVINGSVPLVRDAEVQVERPDGTRITVIANIVPLKDAAGKVTGAINCIYDVTDRKAADRALADARVRLAEHAGRLAAEVRERTGELTSANKRLKTAAATNQKGKEEYQRLFAQSESMQVKLKRLTRQIIMAQEQERKRISRELHDDVVQTLVGINVELAALGKGSSLGSTNLRRKIARAQRLVAGSVTSVHRFARELRPAALDDLGLIPALHTFMKNLSQRKRLRINLKASEHVENLGTNERIVLFRVAQEALNNIVRHAEATTVNMSIMQVDGSIRMEISDDGKSFDVDKTLGAQNNRRLGLIGMKERVEMVEGVLTIVSPPGKGTTITAELPFKAAAEA
jgi:two-component system sensor histidine kinase DegS